MYLNMLITAIIGIVSFALAILGNYYQTPMGIIGKFYANSMLVLINSRMLLGSEVPLTIISVMRFDAAPATAEDRNMMEISQCGQASLEPKTV